MGIKPLPKALGSAIEGMQQASSSPTSSASTSSTSSCATSGRSGRTTGTTCRLRARPLPAAPLSRRAAGIRCPAPPRPPAPSRGSASPIRTGPADHLADPALAALNDDAGDRLPTTCSGPRRHGPDQALLEARPRPRVPDETRRPGRPSRARRRAAGWGDGRDRVLGVLGASEARSSTNSCSTRATGWTRPEPSGIRAKVRAELVAAVTAERGSTTALDALRIGYRRGLRIAARDITSRTRSPTCPHQSGRPSPSLRRPPWRRPRDRP